MLQPTMPTLKPLSIPIRLPFYGVDVSAARTSLAGIGRRHKYNGHASDSSLVSNKHSELVKRPVVSSSSFSFASGFGIKILPNSGQVFKCQCRIGLFRVLYQLLADSEALASLRASIVINPFLEPSFSPRKPSEQPSRVASAFGLNVSPNLAKLVTNGLNLTSIPGLSGGSSSNIATPQVYPNYFRGFTCWRGINLNDKVDVVITLTRFLQCCTGQILTSEQRYLIATEGQLEIDSSRLQCDSHNLLGLNIFECPHIKANGSRSEFVDFFNCFGIANNSPNSLADVICFKSSHFSNWLVNQVVKFSSVPAFLTFCYFQYLIASISKSLQSLIDFWSILYGNYKFAFYRQGLSHMPIVTHLGGRRLKPLPRFPLHSKEMEFLASEVS
jgi:hypothetical protein